MQSLLATLSPATAGTPATASAATASAAAASSTPTTPATTTTPSTASASKSTSTKSSSREGNKNTPSCPFKSHPLSTGSATHATAASHVLQAEHGLAYLEHRLLTPCKQHEERASAMSSPVSSPGIFERVGDTYANRIVGMRVDNLRHAFLSLRIALKRALPSSPDYARLSIKVACVVLHRWLSASMPCNAADDTRGDGIVTTPSNKSYRDLHHDEGDDDDDEYDGVYKYYSQGDIDINHEGNDDNVYDGNNYDANYNSDDDNEYERESKLSSQQLLEGGDSDNKEATLLVTQKMSQLSVHPNGCAPSSSPPSSSSLRQKRGAHEHNDTNIDISAYDDIEVDVDVDMDDEGWVRTDGSLGVAVVQTHTIRRAIRLVNCGLRLFTLNDPWLSDGANAQAYVSGWVCRGLLYDALYRALSEESGSARKRRRNGGVVLGDGSSQLAPMGKSSVVRGARGVSAKAERIRVRRQMHMMECIRSLEIGLAGDGDVVVAAGERGNNRWKTTCAFLRPLLTRVGGGKVMAEGELVRSCGASVQGIERVRAAVALARMYCNGLDDVAGDSHSDGGGGGGGGRDDRKDRGDGGNEGVGAEAARMVLHGVWETVVALRQQRDGAVAQADGVFVSGDGAEVEALAKEAQALAQVVKMADSPPTSSGTRCVLC